MGKRKGRKSRGGRPRKPLEEARRKPNGKTRDRRDPGPTPEALAQRQALLPGGWTSEDPALLCSAAMGTAIGRLSLDGSITDQQRKAGERWWRTVTAYEQLLLAPRQPNAVDPNQPKGRVHTDDHARFQRVRAEYEAGHAVLLTCGRLVLMAVNDALWERQPNVKRLRRGLDALALAARDISQAGAQAVDLHKGWCPECGGNEMLTTPERVA